MGTAVSRRKNLRNDAISSVAAKVRAARAFGEYLHTHPESRNGSDHLLSDTLIGHDSDSPDSVCTQNNNHHQNYPLQDPSSSSSSSSADPSLINPTLGLLQPPPPPPPSSSTSLSSSSKSRLSLERSFSAEEEQQKCVECSLQPSRVYTISGESAMLASKESLELEVLRGARDAPPSSSQALGQPSASSSTSSSPTQQHHHRHGGGGGGSHHHGNHHHHHGGTGGGGTNPGPSSSGAGPSQQQHHHHHHHLSQPLHSSVSAHNIRGWGEAKECGLACEACSGAPSRSQGSLDLESSAREAGKQPRRPLERMCSVDRVTGLDRDDGHWYPKENMFTFQTATTTIQAISNFRKHLRMVGSRRMKAQTFAERRAKSFNRSWSDPTPVKQDSLQDSKDSGDLQASCATLEDGGCDDMDWEEEREMERAACEGDDFVPPKVMLISSKVPKAEYVPNIIRRDDPSIIPILYDHEHATFDDILEEIEKRLTSYRRGCKIWRMLIFCQGGPGHLYLLKNKVATFAKVEKEEDMSQFWKRLSRFMSKLNPEPNLIHIMGCYVLGNPNGEKLFQKLKNLMRPYSVTFESPLELSAQGKEMIEMYFDFRLYRLWKTRQHSKLLDYEDLL
ncbi:LOW QUALITY PROTEIN: NMDA receptor synaptonuclear signaling and neuronal migration factor [Colossoma macropomum]|uniref:LOW QUALITY PROTEIN: NMDA receptor synaptonuclear signaling and neuronal migration factor n=1 Tax=Colossoma macropomum TaxID=42526 RepID=UPI001864C2B1|nr:LOW QUALITY PROTEIN: NMDA receptor synaptonuclear signaling and neuronal migration factor [Colossoma macropomum]